MTKETIDITPEKAAQGIAFELKNIRCLVDNLTKAGDELAEAEANYKIKFAKQRLIIRAASTEKLTVGEVEDWAIENCAEELQAFLIAENRHVSTKEALRASEHRLDGMRS